MRAKTLWVTLLCLLWSGIGLIAQEEEPEPIIREAEVNQVDVIVFETDPIQISVDVRGNLSDGCTTLGDTEQAIEGNTITITLFVESPGGVFCTQMLAPYVTSIPIDATTLFPGEYTVVVNGVSSMFTLTEVDFRAQAAEVATCPASGNGRFVFTNGDLGYCLQTPADAEIKGRYPDLVIVEASRWDYPDIRPNVMITATDANERTLQDIVSQFQEGNAGLQVTQTTIGGQPAVVIEGLPGRNENRQAFILVEGTLYQIIAQPFNADLRESIATEALWSTTLESLTFIPPEPPPLGRPGFDRPVFDDPGFGLMIPVLWELVQSGDEFAIFEPEVANPLIRIRVLDDDPEFAAALAESEAEAAVLLLFQYFREQRSNDRIYFEAGMRHPLFDAIVYGITGVCQRGIIRADDGRVWQVDIQAEACGAPNSTIITHDDVQIIIESMRILSDG